MQYFERLKELRTERGLTQEELCRRCCIRQRSYSDYEKGRTNIPVSALIRIAGFFDVSMAYICGVSDCRGHFDGTIPPLSA